MEAGAPTGTVRAPKYGPGTRSPRNPPTAPRVLRDRAATSRTLGGNRQAAESFLDWVRRCGFGRKAAIPPPGEVTGPGLPRKSWDALTYSRMAVGHALAVAPVQMAMGVAAVANGGVLMKPQVVQEIRG